MTAIEQLEKLSREAEIHAYESRYIDRELNARLDARFEAFQEAIAIVQAAQEALAVDLEERAAICRGLWMEATQSGTVRLDERGPVDFASSCATYGAVADIVRTGLGAAETRQNLPGGAE